MADSTNFQQVVMRTSGDAILKAGLRRKGSPAFKAGRAALWTALMLVGAVTLAPISRYARQEAEILRVLETGKPAPVDLRSADYIEALSELASEAGVALLVARSAVDADPSRAFVWARIAYLEAAKAGKVGAASLEAITRSMDACPLCDEELIRWRFNFVLANWAAMPEAIRTRAFEHAEFLSWSGANAEFLAEMRIKSDLIGIPFAAYRSAVKTPVKSWNLPPAPDAVATSQPAAPG